MSSETFTFTPAREGPEGPTLLAPEGGKPTSENDYFLTSEWKAKQGSEPVSAQPENPVVLVVSGSSTPSFPQDSATNARDTGLVSRAVGSVVFGSEAIKNDWNDCFETTPATTPSSTDESTLDSTLATTPEATSEPVPEALRLLSLVGTDEDPYQDGHPWAYANEPGGRVFMITQNLEHPSTGQTLITTEQIEKALAKKGVKQFVWILHDKDVYTAAEVAKNPALIVGSPKAQHVHVVIQRSSFASIAQVARAFGVPPQCVESKPPSAFLDLVEYLTHENPKQQAAGKHLYDDSEVKASKGWDWRSDLEEHKAARQEKGLGKALQRRRKEAALKVASGEWSLDYVRQHDLDLWSAPGVMSHLKGLRADYLASLAPPLEVVNFYVFGPGGVGKDLLAHALARSLNPTAEKPYFTVGGSNVSFEDYDGEEVIIWSDFRASTMLDACRRDRGLLFRVLGPYRDASEKVIVNIKGSHTQLVNRVNIVTGPDDYRTFLDGLAGEYTYTNRVGVTVVQTSENKDQAYRRFPLIIPVQEGEFSVYVNLGFLNGTREYQQYEKHERLRHGLEQLNRRCQAIADVAERESVVREVEARTVAPILEQRARLTSSADEQISGEDLLAEFATAGQTIVDPEPTPEEIAAEQKRLVHEQTWEMARQVLNIIQTNKRAAEYKAAEEQREANKRARKEHEKKLLAEKKAELAALGELDRIRSVRIEYLNGEPWVVVPEGRQERQPVLSTESPWTL